MLRYRYPVGVSRLEGAARAIRSEVNAYEVAGRRVEVTGTGYAAKGEFKVDAKNIELTTNADAEGPLRLALRIGALCNDAKLEHSGDSITVLGDPTEAALIVAAEKAGLDRAAMERDYPRTGEVPFSSETKRMATVHGTPDGHSVAYVKGSPAAMLEASVSVLGPTGGITPMTDEARKQSRATNEVLAASALRVLGLAYRELPAQHREEDLRAALARTRGRCGRRATGGSGCSRGSNSLRRRARCRVGEVNLPLVDDPTSRTCQERGRREPWTLD